MSKQPADSTIVREYLRTNSHAERVLIHRARYWPSLGRTLRTVDVYGPLPNATHLRGWWGAGTVEGLMERI